MTLSLKHKYLDWQISLPNLWWAWSSFLWAYPFEKEAQTFLSFWLRIFSKKEAQWCHGNSRQTDKNVRARFCNGQQALQEAQECFSFTFVSFYHPFFSIWQLACLWFNTTVFCSSFCLLNLNVFLFQETRAKFSSRRHPPYSAYASNCLIIKYATTQIPNRWDGFNYYISVIFFWIS